MNFTITFKTLKNRCHPQDKTHTHTELTSRNPNIMGILTLPLLTSLLKPHFSLVFTTTRNRGRLFHHLPIRRRFTTSCAVTQHHNDQSPLIANGSSSNAEKRGVNVSIPTFQQAIQRLQVVFCVC
ncbi:Glycine-tRNA ligase, alpha subunit [Artemisia annua]|uniref:Glycine-tRNA ligase, alpha subunit n=1 Tax=Artemisia annua TaxID=35608 RepID=A0A2U1PNH9_ARTAN|nr:Glycine-tRNA ligase, alpha subunit [Artemisia annua]